MDTRLTQQGIVKLRAGEILRLRDAAGRHLGVVDGAVWLTQEDDSRDYVVAGGDSFRFSRNGLALVLPLRENASVVLEDGLAPVLETEHPLLATTRRAWRLAPEHDCARSRSAPAAERPPAYSLQYELDVRRQRAAAIAKTLQSFARRITALWKLLAAKYSMLLERRRTLNELRALNDHMLKDIGLRRDQLEGLGDLLAAKSSDRA